MKNKEVLTLYQLLKEMAKTDLPEQVWFIKKVYRGIVLRNFEGEMKSYFLNKLSNRLFELGYTNSFCGYIANTRTKKLRLTSGR